MKSLIPKKVHKYYKFTYHVVPIINSTKFNLTKVKEEYVSKIFYRNLLIHNKKDEEILFGYKIGEYLKELFEIIKKDKGKDNNKVEENSKIVEDSTKEISLLFGKDLEMLLNNKMFQKELNVYFERLDFSLFKSQTNKCRIRYILIKNPDFNNKEFLEYFESLLNMAKNIKKNNLINEEIGVSYFYKYLFEKENNIIFGMNLKNKIRFALKKMIINTNSINDENEEIDKIINKVNFYDISYICMKNNINFYKEYIDQKFKDFTKTQKLAYIIQNNKILRNTENLSEYKNKFYIDEKGKIENKLYINIKKKKFYKKCSDIMNILKNSTDFTINDNFDKKNTFQINFIDPEKFKEINNISNEINNI
jgi:hypothetical protein